MGRQFQTFSLYTRISGWHEKVSNADKILKVKNFYWTWREVSVPPKFIFTQSLSQNYSVPILPRKLISTWMSGCQLPQLRAPPPALKTSGRKYKERPSLRHNNQFICNLCFFDATPFRRGRPLSLENIKTMVLVILISTAVDISILLLCFGHSTVDIFQSFYRGFCSFFVYLKFSILSAMTSSQWIPFLHISKQGETWWLASSQIN